MKSSICISIILLILLFIVIACIVLIGLLIQVIMKCKYDAYYYALHKTNTTTSFASFQTKMESLFPHVVSASNTKTFLKTCGDLCINKKLTFNKDATAFSYNNWNEDSRKKGGNGAMLVWEFIKAYMIQDYAVPICTGGTSGNSFHYWYSYEEGIRFLASTMRCWVPFGWHPGKKLGIFYGHPSSGLSVLNYTRHILPNMDVLIPKFDEKGDVMNWEAFVRFINSRKPYVVESMPNLFFRVCQLAYVHDVTFSHQPHLISLSGDFLFTCQYEFIKACFPFSIVRMAYGSVEVGQIAQQRSDDDLYTYKVFSEYAHIENTEDGRLVISRLDYVNMPMFRYITDDYGNVHNDTITNLVGKKKFDYLSLDKLINYVNKQFQTHIINTRYDIHTTMLHVTTLHTDLSYVTDVCSDVMKMNVHADVCVKTRGCKVRYRLDNKVLPTYR